jgi:hypothetical protein
LTALQVTLPQLPKPLKEMTMALLFNTESELKKQKQEFFEANGTYPVVEKITELNCKLGFFN